MSKSEKENNTNEPKEASKTIQVEENKKIQIHLDGGDFAGFTWRIAGVAAISLVITWTTNLNEVLVFITATLCWLVYFFYKIMRFKDEAYHQIIEDLEAKNDKLDKSNKLLQNIVKDSMGMPITTKESPPKKE